MIMVLMVDFPHSPPSPPSLPARPRLTSPSLPPFLPVTKQQSLFSPPGRPIFSPPLQHHFLRAAAHTGLPLPLTSPWSLFLQALPPLFRSMNFWDLLPMTSRDSNLLSVLLISVASAHCMRSHHLWNEPRLELFLRDCGRGA